MATVRRLIPGLAAIAAALAFGLWARERLPAEVVTHWGLDGQPDGWSSRGSAVLMLPALGAALAAMFVVLPRIDPRRESYELHGRTYWLLANATLVFLSAVHVAAVGVNLGWPIRIEMLTGIGVGALFMLIGNLMTRMRPNWFMGIRTPWTLSSETVWRKTHRVGGYTFVAAGAAMAIAGAVRSSAVGIVAMVSVGIAAIVPLAYSYFAWRAESEASKPGARART